MKRQDTAGQLGDLQERADQLAERQKEVENQLRQSYAGNSKDGKGGTGLNRQQSEQVASELNKNLEDLKKLEQDIQTSARDLRSTQPDASTRLRDGVSEIQQNDVERRIQYSAEYIRQGRGDQVNQSGWLPPVNRAMDTMRDGIRQAQQALSDGTKQGAGKNERDQQLAQVESLRRQIEQFARGQQNGQQQGNQQGQDGKQGGQQPGQQPGQGRARVNSPDKARDRAASSRVSNLDKARPAGIRMAAEATSSAAAIVMPAGTPVAISVASLDAGIRRATTICRTAGAWSRARWFATTRAI